MTMRQMLLHFCGFFKNALRILNALSPYRDFCHDKVPFAGFITYKAGDKRKMSAKRPQCFDFQ